MDTRASYRESSLALDSKNNPHISYSAYLSFKKRYGDIYSMYACWNGSSWDIQTVDSEAGEGSIVLDSNDYPHIAYSNETGLIYACWNGSKWDMQTVDPSGKGASLALDSNDQLHISYLKDGDLKYAKFNGLTWSIQTVDSGGSLLSYDNSMALDSNNYPHIIYAENVEFRYSSETSPTDKIHLTNNIKYAAWTGSEWRIQTAISNASSIGKIALDSKGYPHLSYIHDNFYFIRLLDRESFRTEESLIYAYWDGTAWNTQIVDSKPYYVWYWRRPCLALDSDDKPHICFRRESLQNVADTGLIYTKWTGSSWSIQTVDANESAMWVGSLVLDSHDNVHISYSVLNRGSTYNFYGDLMYATLSGSTPIAEAFPSELLALTFLSLLVIVPIAIFAYKRRKSINSQG